MKQTVPHSRMSHCNMDINHPWVPPNLPPTLFNTIEFCLFMVTWHSAASDLRPFKWVNKWQRYRGKIDVLIFGTTFIQDLVNVEASEQHHK